MSLTCQSISNWTFQVGDSIHCAEIIRGEAGKSNLFAIRKGDGLHNWIFSVQFSHSVISDSDPMNCSTPGLPVHHQLQVYSNSCPLSQWCHPTISSSVIPFSSHLQSFPESGSFQMSQLFALGGQSIGVSASTSVLPMNVQDWSPLGWTGWISLQGTLKSLLQYHSSKASILWLSAFFIVQLSHPYMTPGKTIALTRWTITLLAK